MCVSVCGSAHVEAVEYYARVNLRRNITIKEPELSHFAEDRQHLDSFPTLSTYRPIASVHLLPFACPAKSLETAQALVSTLAYSPS